VRRSPCGSGSSTYDEMRIHKRVLTLICPIDLIRKVTSIFVDHGVNVELSIRVD
jgi:small subunit ribosomal protein S20e